MMRINGQHCGLVGCLFLTFTGVCFYINSLKSIGEWALIDPDNVQSEIDYRPSLPFHKSNSAYRNQSKWTEVYPANIESQMKNKLVPFHKLKSTNGNRSKTSSKKCGSYVSNAVTNASLLEFYTTCVDTAGKHPITEVGTELFKAVFKEDNFKNVICEEKERRFITGQDLVALPSVPGSGNTWTRQLLEYLTGTYTPCTI